MLCHAGGDTIRLTGPGHVPLHSGDMELKSIARYLSGFPYEKRIEINEVHGLGKNLHVKLLCVFSPLKKIVKIHFTHFIINVILFFFLSFLLW